MFDIRRRLEHTMQAERKRWTVRNMRSCLPIVVFLTALAVAQFPVRGSTIAAATWSLTLDAPAQSGAPNTLIVYSGAITNTTGSDLVLESAFIDFSTSAPASSYLKDYSDDFLSTLGIIPVAGYQGPLFFIEWLSAAPAGAAGTGHFELTADAPASPDLLSVDFSASMAVSQVPEPGAAAIIGAGLICMAVFRRRSRAAA